MDGLYDNPVQWLSSNTAEHVFLPELDSENREMVSDKTVHAFCKRLVQHIRTWLQEFRALILQGSSQYELKDDSFSSWR